MDLFLELIGKVVPLLLLIGLGILAGRKAAVSKESVALLLIYFIEPGVVFLALLRSNFELSYAVLPLCLFLLCFPIAAAMQRLGTLYWKDDTPNLFFFATSTPNTMYFGVPIVIACLGEKFVPVYILTQIGFYFFTFTIGYYVLARGKYSARNSWDKLRKLPVIWALFLGLPLAFIDVPVPEIVENYTSYLTGTMIILGMMMVGLALADKKTFTVDYRILGAIFMLRYLLWPIAIASLVFLDQTFFQLYDPNIHRMLFVFGTLPMAISFVTYAVQTGIKPEVAATAVLITSIFSVFYIPVVFALLL